MHFCRRSVTRLALRPDLVVLGPADIDAGTAAIGVIQMFRWSCQASNAIIVQSRETSGRAANGSSSSGIPVSSPVTALMLSSLPVQ